MPVRGIPLVREGDDLAPLILAALERQGTPLSNGAVLVVAQKIVSKAEGRRVALTAVTPGARALTLAAETHKDSRFVQVVLDESSEVVRTGHDVLIVESRQGFICANAGVDHTNAGASEEDLTLLPRDADASAAALRARLRELRGVEAAVIISDTHGRAFRLGAVGVAIGVAGMAALRDLRGQKDLFGHTFRVTTVAVADELASAATLVMGEAAEGVPAALIEGLAVAGDASGQESGARALLRPRELDLFR
ncbi:MAG: coenzyme F420-0:L-glutamate ligase [Candidatus Tectomicrobia bacterium]|nr:coenzyme F420-0:L-glutamate ligase [Candidatus Tectomicrobia bacterium]